MLKSFFVILFNQSELLGGGKDCRRRHKALVRSTMAARSFSSPQGELEMHRLRRALERVSFDQTLGGRLDESDGETKPPSRGTLSCRSLTDSSKLYSHSHEVNLSHLPSLIPISRLHNLSPQMDSCSPPPRWTGTASQTQSTCSLPPHQRIPHRVSAAHSFMAC